jgi:hypothetical protein
VTYGVKVPRVTKGEPLMTTPARRATAKTTTPVKIEETPEFQAALAKAVADAVAKATAKVPGYRAYATKEISPAVKQYVKWLIREFPELELDETNDARLVQVVIRGYGWFQKSDLSLKATKDRTETA